MKLKKDRLGPLTDFLDLLRNLSPDNRRGAMACAEVQIMKQPAYAITDEDRPILAVMREVFALGGEECKDPCVRIYSGIRGAQEAARRGLSIEGRTFRDLSHAYRKEPL